MLGKEIDHWYHHVVMMTGAKGFAVTMMFCYLVRGRQRLVPPKTGTVDPTLFLNDFIPTQIPILGADVGNDDHVSLFRYITEFDLCTLTGNHIHCNHVFKL